MEYLAYLLSAVLLGAWVWIGHQVLVGLAFPSAFTRHLHRATAGVLVIGVVSFLAFATSSWLPPSVEWPVGLAGTTHTTKDGHRIVVHTASGRVQIYDREWHFLRGINIDSRGGSFLATVHLDDSIEVFVYRGSNRFVFDLNGTLLATTTNSHPTSHGSEHITFGPWVPTRPWLFSLTSPACSFLLVILGLACAVAVDYVHPGRPKPAEMARAREIRERFAGQCPGCGHAIPLDDIDIPSDKVTCRECGLLSPVPALEQSPHECACASAPVGCSVQASHDRWSMIADIRNGRVWLLVAFVICSMAMISLAALWIRDYATSRPLVIVSILALSGLAAWWLVLLWNAALNTMGRLELTVRNGRLTVSAGFGPFVLSRTRKLAEIVAIKQRRRSSDFGSSHDLEVACRRPLRFGKQLTDAHRYHVHHVLITHLRQRRHERGPSAPRDLA